MGGGANSPLFTADIKINGFIHVAGIAQFSAIKHFSIKQSEKMFRINVFSACEIIRILSSKGYKKYLEYIIFLSSIAAHRGYKIMSLYGASKASLCALSRSLSIELAPITRVNSIVLGGIRTSGTEFLYTEDFSQRMQEIYPLGQGNISDIANLVDFLCNAKSRWISGQNIFIDGGLSNLGHS
ncbi:SDR family oxidoreductase [Helicobacter muridarum]|uniref:Oxidoreductase n=1 Tax=Helicobacter muridarum TaxID=216 RepID=A0A377PRT9_9HELI|nr:SDR family oxidoreductase [Helicobacter muridarum]TLD98688.1 SDR family oxidoreductase [Helicobacter muridarum]STQ85556.1 oxidoreductase [Helicobacter muridarum]